MVSQDGVKIPSLASEIHQAKDFRQSLYRNINMTRRDLWAISSVLGHGHPETSLEHYIHIMDIGLAWYLDQEEIAPSLSVVSMAANKNLSTIYRQNKDEGLHAWVAAQWQRKFQSKEKKQKLQPKSKTPSLDSNSIIDEFEQIWRCLYLYDAKQSTIEELSKMSFIDSDELSRYIYNASYLCGLFNSQNQSSQRHRFIEEEDKNGVMRRLICPSPLSKTGDQNVLKRFAMHLSLVNSENPKLTQRLLHYYAECAHPKLTGFHFENPDNPQDAIDCLTWLDNLGLGKKDLRINVFDESDPKAVAKLKWQRALKLRSNQISQSKPPFGRKEWACPWLEITPIIGERENKKASAAFRYLMIMAYILIKE
jgi:hypothetical protein